MALAAAMESFEIEGAILLMIAYQIRRIAHFAG